LPPIIIVVKFSSNFYYSLFSSQIYIKSQYYSLLEAPQITNQNNASFNDREKKTKIMYGKKLYGKMINKNLKIKQYLYQRVNTTHRFLSNRSSKKRRRACQIWSRRRGDGGMCQRRSRSWGDEGHQRWEN
jgi:hypothetical protein